MPPSRSEISPQRQRRKIFNDQYNPKSVKEYKALGRSLRDAILMGDTELQMKVERQAFIRGHNIYVLNEYANVLISNMQHKNHTKKD